MLIHECNPNAAEIYAGPGSSYQLASQISPQLSVSLLLTRSKHRHLPEWQTQIQQVGVEIHRNNCRKRRPPSVAVGELML